MSAHSPQRASHAISLITRRQQRRRIPASVRCVSLGIFRDKKVPRTQAHTQQPPETAAVPSIHRTSTVYPPLRLVTAVSARPKRDKRRLPIFPPGNDWGDIRGGSAGDDAWVVGKYYLGMYCKNPSLAHLLRVYMMLMSGRGCGWCRRMEYKAEWTACIMVPSFNALLGTRVRETNQFMEGGKRDRSERHD